MTNEKRKIVQVIAGRKKLLVLDNTGCLWEGQWVDTESENGTNREMLWREIPSELEGRLLSDKILCRIQTSF